MSRIAEILESGKSARLEVTPVPSEEEVRAVEGRIGFVFPQSYRDFLSLGGLDERRINHSVLSPAEIEESLQYLPAGSAIPFADNGCGDLYCWTLSNATEPSVVFADHETGSFAEESTSFEAWLEKNKF
jgi:hypothetical protein